MTIARASIIRGPAVVMHRGLSLYTEGDISVTPNIEVFDTNTSMFGKVDKRRADILVDIEFTPVGEWEGLAVLYAHTTPAIGSSIFGADESVIIQTLAGKKLSYYAGAITKIPNITFSAVKPLLGPMKITAIGADNEAWSATAHRAKVEAEAFSDTGFDPTKILTQAYVVGWSGAPWAAIETEEGVSVEFDLGLKPVKVDSSGTVDMTLESLDVTAKFVPVGVSEDEVIAALSMQGAGVLRGTSLLAASHDLTIAGTGVHAIVYNAAPGAGPLMFGRTILRAGEVVMHACRSFTDGVADPMFYVGTAAP